MMKNNFTFGIVTLKDGKIDGVVKTLPIYNFLVDKHGKYVSDAIEYAKSEGRKMIEGLSKVLIDDTLVLVEFHGFHNDFVTGAVKYDSWVRI